MKIFFFDVETTGLNPIENDILTLSGITEIDGKVEHGIHLKIQPHSYENINPKALEVNGLTVEEIKTFDSPQIALAKIKRFFEKFIDPYKKDKPPFYKFLPAGYNVPFDIQFLEQFFKKCGDNYFGTWFDYHKLDVLSLVYTFYQKGKLQDVENFKLSTICNKFDVSINAHDSKSDIIATRELFYKMLDKVNIGE